MLWMVQYWYLPATALSQTDIGFAIGNWTALSAANQSLWFQFSVWSVINFWVTWNNCLKDFLGWFLVTLMIFGLLDRTRPTSKRTRERSPFHPKGASTPKLSFSQRANPLPTNTSSVPTITDGCARAGCPQRLFTSPLRRPDCTLSRLPA